MENITRPGFPRDGFDKVCMTGTGTCGAKGAVMKIQAMVRAYKGQDFLDTCELPTGQMASELLLDAMWADVSCKKKGNKYCGEELPMTFDRMDQMTDGIPSESFLTSTCTPCMDEFIKTGKGFVPRGKGGMGNRRDDHTDFGDDLEGIERMCSKQGNKFCMLGIEKFGQDLESAIGMGGGGMGDGGMGDGGMGGGGMGDRGDGNPPPPPMNGTGTNGTMPPPPPQDGNENGNENGNANGNANGNSGGLGKQVCTGKDPCLKKTIIPLMLEGMKEEDDMDMGPFFDAGCNKDKEKYCLDTYISGENLVLGAVMDGACTGTTCSDACKTALQSYLDALGCCGGNLYKMMEDEAAMSKCSVTVPAGCNRPGPMKFNVKIENLKWAYMETAWDTNAADWEPLAAMDMALFLGLEEDAILVTGVASGPNGGTRIKFELVLPNKELAQEIKKLIQGTARRADGASFSLDALGGALPADALVDADAGLTAVVDGDSIVDETETMVTADGAPVGGTPAPNPTTSPAAASSAPLALLAVSVSALAVVVGGMY